jgi:hypothetical protein
VSVESGREGFGGFGVGIGDVEWDAGWDGDWDWGREKEVGEGVLVI